MYTVHFKAKKFKTKVALWMWSLKMVLILKDLARCYDLHTLPCI